MAAKKTNKHKKKSKNHQTTKHEGFLESIDQHKLKPNEYDLLFEKKLAEQYRDFRDLKDHHLQMRKFLRILVGLLVIIALALLLLSFNL